MPAVARRGAVGSVLTALLVDVLGALGEGNDLVAGEDLGAVRLLAARGAEGLAAGVAEAHGVQILRGHSGAVVVVRVGGARLGVPRGASPLPTRSPSPPWHSAGRSWRTARPPRCQPSCPRGTAGAGPRGAAPCPPSPPRGACRMGMGTGTGLGPSPFAGPGGAPCRAGAAAPAGSRSGGVPTRVRVPAPYPQRGQRRRPSAARPRRQLAQKLW